MGMTPAFLAGSTEFKWSNMPRFTLAAHGRGMWMHVARVNTIGKVRRCVDEGVDSADGTGIWRGDRTQLAGVLEALVERPLFSTPP